MSAADLLARDVSAAAGVDLDAMALRFRVEQLYADYVAALDERRLDDWPDFFTDDCDYRVIARENWQRGLPLATIALESKPMLRDRVYGANTTLFHDPYYQRHLVSGLKVWREGDAIRAEANYLVIRTKLNEPSSVYNAGRYLDRLVEADGRLLFAQKVCVFDSELVPNSIIYPI